MMAAYVLLLLNIVLLLAGQTLWKFGLERMGGIHLHNALSVMTSPLIMSGCVLYGVATVLWLAVLSRLPLSTAYPMQSLAYVFGLLLAWLLFGEAIPQNRWIGAGIILVGVSVVGVK
jgi:drug/metabolite transporter (DMT)-like permease